MGVTKTKVATDKLSCQYLLNLFESGMLCDSHPLQRRADQFDREQRDGFIATVIKNEDFDSIKVCEQVMSDGTTISWLIDGIQRLSTLCKFKAGEFRIGKNLDMPIITYQVVHKGEDGKALRREDGTLIYDTIEYDLRGKAYKNLPVELKNQFDNCPINEVKHLECTDDEIAYHIRRYNHQKAMNKNQIGITHVYEYANKIKDITNNCRFFNVCGHYTASDRKNGNLERIVMESIMSIFHLSDWKKNQAKIGDYLNENGSKYEFDILKGYFNDLMEIIPESDSENAEIFNEVFNAKNTFIWMAVYDKFTKTNIEDGSRFKDFIIEFCENLQSVVVDEVGDSYETICDNRSTKDTRVVVGKIKIISTLMYEYLGVEDVDLIETIDIEEPEDESESEDDVDVNGIKTNETSVDADFEETNTERVVGWVDDDAENTDNTDSISSIDVSDSDEDSVQDNVQDESESDESVGIKDGWLESDVEELNKSDSGEKLLNTYNKEETYSFLCDNAGVDDEDISQDLGLYVETLDDLMLGNTLYESSLYDSENVISLLAMVARSYKYDLNDLDSWFADYVSRTDTYEINQKLNYNTMFDDYEKYVMMNLAA